MSLKGSSNGHRNAYTRSSTHSSLIKEYTDLSAADINALTAILSHAPKPSSPLQDLYKDQVQQRIAQLPLHLRSKIPWLTTSCPMHSKLNPLPINDMLGAIRQEIDHHVPKTWLQLQSQSVLSGEQKRMIQVLGDIDALWTKPERRGPEYSLSQASHEYQSNKCGACILARIGGNVEVVTAIGASFIGRFKRSVWKRSKRLVWIEAWVRQSVEDGQEDAAVRRMWKLGRELRKVRKSARCLDQDGDEGDAEEEPIAKPVVAAHTQQGPQDKPFNDYADFSANPFTDQPEASSLFEMSGGIGPRSAPASTVAASTSRRPTSTRRNDSAIFSHQTTVADVFEPQNANLRPSTLSTTASPTSRRSARPVRESRNHSAVFSRQTLATDLFDVHHSTTRKGTPSNLIASEARESAHPRCDSHADDRGVSTQSIASRSFNSNQTSTRRGASSVATASTARSLHEPRTDAAVFSPQTTAEELFSTQHSTRARSRAASTAASTASRRYKNAAQQPRVESWLSEQTSAEDVFRSHTSSRDRRSEGPRHSTTVSEVVGMYGHSTVSQSDPAASRRTKDATRRPRVESALSEHTTAAEVFDEQGTSRDRRGQMSRQSVSNTELTGMYERSTSSRAASAMPQPLFAAGTHRRRPDPELAKYPRQKMPPITTLGGHPGVELREDPEVRKIQKRGKLLSRPAFRRGTNGQIKGPGDTVDNESILTGLNSEMTADGAFF